MLNLAIDGTGPSPTTRSEYIRYKHKVKHGFVRLVRYTDTDTREILRFSVTDDAVREAWQFENLTCIALENACSDGTAQSVQRDTGVKQSPEDDEPPDEGRCPDRPQEMVMRADGGFDSRKIFEFCRHLGITPYVRINHNATTRSRGVSRARTMAVLDQLGGGITDPAKFAQLAKDERGSNRKKWKECVQYGQRWLVEIII